MIRRDVTLETNAHGDPMVWVATDEAGEFQGVYVTHGDALRSGAAASGTIARVQLQRVPESGAQSEPAQRQEGKPTESGRDAGAVLNRPMPFRRPEEEPTTGSGPQRSMAFYRSDVDCAADDMAVRLVGDYLSTEDPDERASELAQVIGDAVDGWFRETADAPTVGASQEPPA